VTPETLARMKTLNRMPSPGKALTRRELAVLRLVALGMSNEQVGAELHYTAGTVKTMMLRILRKLEAPNRAAAVDRGWRLGYLEVGLRR
jgi:DNA-binding NarL/FixJ family response regulator